MEQNTLSPKNFFLQFGIIVSLYVSTISFLSFVFDLINIAYPESNVYGYIGGYSGGMRASISAIIVFFPLFIWLSKSYRKSVGENEIKEGKLRKWLIFLTLFITGLAMAIDVVILLNAFLGGNDITTPFILKVLSVLVVCATVFYFYLKDVKGYWTENKKAVNIFSYVVSIIVLLSIVGGFIYIGSPATQRKITQDSLRVDNLISIQSQVTTFYQQKGRLPNNITEMKDPLSSYSVIPQDPETKMDYEYIKEKDLSFSICANFALESTKQSASNNMIYRSAADDENWKHETGRTCFTRTIDPQKYPLFDKNLKPEGQN